MRYIQHILEEILEKADDALVSEFKDFVFNSPTDLNLLTVIDVG